MLRIGANAFDRSYQVVQPGAIERVLPRNSALSYPPTKYCSLRLGDIRLIPRRHRPRHYRAFLNSRHASEDLLGRVEHHAAWRYTEADITRRC
jgi:hypothetical protein